MRAIALWAAAAVAVAVMAACGSSSDSKSSPAREGPAAFRGCGPGSIAAHLAGFLNAVSERRREVALSYIVPANDLVGFTLSRWAPPRGGREDASTPVQMYESFAKAIGPGESSALLAVEVGVSGPFPEYQEKSGASAIAGVNAVVRIGADVWLSGKYGVDCDTGRIYAGAMNTRDRLRPQTHCGELARPDARKPVLCRI